MPVNMNLWKVESDQLSEISHSNLDTEERLENWIENDPEILSLDLMLIGQQLQTPYAGRIDLLGINQLGELIVIELKKGKTPREVVAQTLDYASWVRSLTTKQVVEIAERYLQASLSDKFSQKFGVHLPEDLNVNHRIVIVAAELDASSERIVQYLAEDYGLDINVVFFNIFRLEDQEILGRVWLIDPQELEERTEVRKRAEWSGFWFVNVGESEHRNWDDNVQHGYIGAGQKQVYSDGLRRLSPGDKIFAYMKGLGYVGYGVVTKEAVMLSKFYPDGREKPLTELDLKAVKARENMDNPAKSEWAVKVDWKKTFGRDQAKWQKGLFANASIACRMFQKATVDFLKREFEITSEELIE